MSLLVAMCIFSLSMSITPGPVNLLTLSTGANYGFRKALPFVTGATTGFTLLLLLIGLGVVELVLQYPRVLNSLSCAGAALIFYMGFKIARSNAQLHTEKVSRPGFYQGFLLQWLNPKAWISSVAGVTAFVSTGSYAILALFCLQYYLICFFSVASWALTGDRVALLLTNELRIKIFNRVMGGGLMLVALYLVATLIAAAA